MILRNSKETATLLAISVRTLERMRSDGTGPKFIRISGGDRRGRVGYDERDIADYIESRRRTSTSDPGPNPPASPRRSHRDSEERRG